MMKRILIFSTLLITSVLIKGQNPELYTWCEKSNFQETPRYDETIKYCKMLEKKYNRIDYTYFGYSPQGRQLPLLIMDKNGNFDPASVKKSGNLIVLIQACIHAGEPDGKDAGLMLVRDLATDGKLNKMLDNITILFIPIYNVDGHERFGPYNRINQNGPKEMGWRVTAQNYNLNRDFLKADAPETQAWLRMFNEWLPDFFIDCHVTDGADYHYPLTYGLEIFGNMTPELTDWTKKTYLKQIEKLMKKAEIPIFPYIEFRKWSDPTSGLTGWLAPPMLSQGYTAIQNRPGLLIETHMLKDYRTRVTATYEMLKNTLNILYNEADNYKQVLKKADDLVSGNDFRKKDFPLEFENTSDSTMVDFMGYEFEIVRSEISGGKWIKYDNLKERKYNLPYFNKHKVIDSCRLPEAYIIPPEWIDIIRRLELHGVKMWKLNKDAEVKIKSYRFKEVKWAKTPYEGRFKINSMNLEELNETRIFPAGSVVIDMNQRTSQVIAHVLEPKAPDSYASWGFFNGLFQQKEYAEGYKLEELAIQMMKDNPSLKIELDEKKKKDPKFAGDPYAILNWFYVKSTYWDSKYYSYPVGKIVTITELNRIRELDK